MKNIEQIMRRLAKLGYRIERGNGSIAKIYPQDDSKQFYSLHIGERAIHPLKRFARKNWNLDISSM